VNNEKCEQLITLFEGLLGKLVVTDKKALSLGELIQQCFNIIAVMSEQDKEVYSIAKSLRVIPRTQQKMNIEKNLRRDLMEIENNLNEDLRGFSCLLDMVLEENTLRVDTEGLVLALPEKYRPLALTFHDLYLHFEAYNGLYLAFGADSREALTLLFLQALKRVMAASIAIDQKEAQDAILSFLKNFVKNQALTQIFALNLAYRRPLEVAQYCASGPVHARAIMTVLICIISAERIVLDERIIDPLDIALQKAGLLGLEPFIESGFIMIDAPTDAEATGIKTPINF